MSEKSNKHEGEGGNTQNILHFTSTSVNAKVDTLLQDKNQPLYQIMCPLSLIYNNGAGRRLSVTG